MGLAQDMAEHDAAILDAIGDTAVVGSDEVKGFFHRKPIEIQTPNAGVIGLDLSFHCRYSAAQDWTTATEIVDQAMSETYRFKRHVPEGGTESGWVYVELGRKL